MRVHPADRPERQESTIQEAGVFLPVSFRPEWNYAYYQTKSRNYR